MISIFSHLIEKISKKYKFANIPKEDLIQEGWLAVIENEDKWKELPSLDANCLMTPFIRSAMRKYCINNQRLVKIVTTKKEIKAVNNLLSYASSPSEVTPATIIKMSKNLNVEEKDIKKASYFVFGSDSHISPEGQVEHKSKWMQMPESSNLQMISERVINLMELEKEIKHLKGKERDVIEMRWFNEKKEPLQSIAKIMSISTSGAALCESNAINKLKKRLNARIAA
ncbi:sigma-70 family RNA polymerase sigma factor [Psychromonas sp. SP041]|uniref:sigma-70 family RNA polymerase sigma factor n=1 Tax=Psychromonas sp. SP041 TaxID=1365007 RepID=UPI00047125E3|nr:sigma-70 family RNA polymerase sigma factor [Psychromonas sp. SP041]